MTTSIISPIAYFKYFPVFPFETRFCRIFLKNFIIDYWLVPIAIGMKFNVHYKRSGGIYAPSFRFITDFKYMKLLVGLHILEIRYWILYLLPYKSYNLITNLFYLFYKQLGYSVGQVTGSVGILLSPRARCS
jgi:hypothetical protein